MDDASELSYSLNVSDDLHTCLESIIAIVLGICSVVIKEFSIDFELVDQVLEGLGV